MDIVNTVLQAVGVTIAGIGLVFTSVFSFLSHRQSRQVNDAVNNVHKSGGKRIYDLALENHQKVNEVKKHSEELIKWKRSYDDSPWKSGEHVKEWLDDHKHILEPCDECPCYCPCRKTPDVSESKDG